MATAHNTSVSARTRHKVEYEWRTFLGLIGSWKEVMNERCSKPSIFIETASPDFTDVYVNGCRYLPDTSEGSV